MGLFPARKLRNKCLFPTPERREKERPRSCRVKHANDYKGGSGLESFLSSSNFFLPSLLPGHSVTPSRAGTGESQEERKREGRTMEGETRLGNE